MAVYKVTMIFNQGVNGWTESFYWTFGGAGFLSGPPVVVGQQAPDAIPALAPWYAVARARVNLLAAGGELQAMRFSDEARPKAAYLDESVSQLVPRDQDERDVKRRALVGTAQAGESLAYRREFTLRGIPDRKSIVDIAGPSNFSFISDLFKVYRDALIRAGAAMKGLAKDVPFGHNPERSIQNIETTGDPAVFVITTAGAHGLLPADEVRMRRIRTVDSPTIPPLNANFRVQPYADATHNALTSFSITLPVLASYAFFRYAGGGLVQKRFYEYPVITYMAADRFASHRTGGAFFVGRGRSPKRAVRR